MLKIKFKFMLSNKMGSISKLILDIIRIYEFKQKQN